MGSTQEKKNLKVADSLAKNTEMDDKTDELVEEVEEKEENFNTPLGKDDCI